MKIPPTSFSVGITLHGFAHKPVSYKKVFQRKKNLTKRKKLRTTSFGPSE